MSSDITVILTLFKTPEKKIRQLNQYKNYKMILFDQVGSLDNKKKTKKDFKIRI